MRWRKVHRWLVMRGPGKSMDKIKAIAMAKSPSRRWMIYVDGVETT